MCGIAGFWDAAVLADHAKRLLDVMCSTLIHRGPDEDGQFVAPPIGLGMRRLSIIDVAHGHQPIGNEDGFVQVVFNGEIYNHERLRRELRELGHRFATASDTEVIVHGYEEWGTDCFARLWGMFAIAVWDGRAKQLVLARDRFGKKPLFYHHRGQTLVFASEMKALLATGLVDREVDPIAVDQYFTYGYIPAPRSVLRSVKKVPPGAYMVFHGHQPTISHYWRLTLREPTRLAEEDAATEIRRLLRDAVRMRLMSEVPLGAFLSGGVDSSAVVATMAELLTAPVKTFSIGFEQREYSELDYAAQVARQFQTEHHAEIVRPDVIGVLPDLVRAFDEPFADESMLPTYYVSRLAHQQVTVVLSGDGGDEAFGGYARYLVALSRANRLRVPGPLRPSLSLLAERWPDGRPGKTRLHALALSVEQRYVETSAIFPDWVRHQVFSDDLRHLLDQSEPYQVQLSRFAETAGRDLLTRMQYVDTHTYLPDDILVKVDRTSMWTSLELRAPFLDHRLFEFAVSLPPSFLARGGGKYILKRAMRDVLPLPILARRKMGFGVPLEHWFRSDLRRFVDDILFDGTLTRRGYIDTGFVSIMWRHHLSGHANHSRRLWSLLCFELWCRAYLDAAAPAATAVA
jgi:asparagine synthase (glutamine-hydrolysing)